MAGIDVSEVLLDSDFLDSLVCVRSTQTINSLGRAVNTSTSIPFSGVVTSDGGDVVSRIEGGERVRGDILVHTMFRLSDSGGTGKSADVVQWQGKSYTVAKVNDYSHFGSGFVCASCDMINISG